MADGSNTPKKTRDTTPAPARVLIDPQGRRHAPPEVWTAVREDYMRGLSGPEACRRHGVKLPTLRRRAAREGWKRDDQPWPAPNRLDPEDEGVALDDRIDGNLDKIEPRQLWYVAHRRMLRAVLRGDPVGAMRWRRVAHAMQAEQAEMDRVMAQEEAVWMQRFGHAEADAIEARLPADLGSPPFAPGK